MKAWQMTAAGTPDVLRLTEMDKPQPAAGEVLIQVKAAGFNPIDTKIRAGLAPIAPESGVLGCDVSGIVKAVGEGVSRFQPGDAVFGMAGGVKGTQGALAEYMVADAALLARAPAALSLAEAAALPIPALTADEALRRLAVRAGDEFYISGASGAVGLMAVQMAGLLGASVEGSGGSAGRLATIARYGGKGLLHSEAGQLISAGRQYSKVLDTFGGVSLQTAMQLAAPYAQVATINARAQYDLSQAHAKALTLHAIFLLLPLLSGQGRAQLGTTLERLANLIDEGKLQGLPVVQAGMSDVADIHRRYEAGKLPDKTVLLADF